MKDHPLYPLAIKLRPVLKTLDGPAGVQEFSEELTVLYLIPFSVAGVVWLALIEMNTPRAKRSGWAAVESG